MFDSNYFIPIFLVKFITKESIFLEFHDMKINKTKIVQKFVKIDGIYYSNHRWELN